MKARAVPVVCGHDLAASVYEKLCRFLLFFFRSGISTIFRLRILISRSFLIIHRGKILRLWLNFDS